MMKMIKNQKELYDFISKVHRETNKHELESLYFLVKYKDKTKDGKDVIFTEPVYFFPYENHWFNCPCRLQRLGGGSEAEIREYVEDVYEKDSVDLAFEYESMLVVDDIHYEIVSLQVTNDYLTYPLEIEPMREKECLKWMIKNGHEVIEYVM